MANKRESVVWLEPIEHKYIHKITGEKFKSVTTVLGMLEPEFNSETDCSCHLNARPVQKERTIPKYVTRRNSC